MKTKSDRVVALYYAQKRNVPRAGAHARRICNAAANNTAIGKAPFGLTAGNAVAIFFSPLPKQFSIYPPLAVFPFSVVGKLGGARIRRVGWPITFRDRSVLCSQLPPQFWHPSTYLTAYLF